jgi:UDP-N-acetylglucosamine:LPS N-acetylglucosamine transferase
MFRKKKNGLTFNYNGMSGGHLFEASLILKLMIERKYKIQNVIIETDLNLSNEKEQTALQVLPLFECNRNILVGKDFFKVVLYSTGTLFSMLKLVFEKCFQFYT